MDRRIVMFFAMVSVLWLSSVASADWTRFRGPNGTGISESAVPTEFGLEQNLKWKLELPGKGVSSPIVVGDKVFVTCYSGYGITRGEGSIEDLKRHLLCVDRKSGQIVWQKTVDSVPEEDPYTGAGVPAHGYASQTPVSDGERVYTFFGKSGVVAYDLDGEKLWQKSVGTDSGRQHWGSAASPIIYGDLVIVNASDEAESLFAFDKLTGEEKWKSHADGYASTWGTPALAPGKEGTDVVLAVPGEIWALNADTGKLRWYAPGNDGASHSVVILDQVAYSVGGGRSGSSGIAVKTGGEGDIGDPVWKNNASGGLVRPSLLTVESTASRKGLSHASTRKMARRCFRSDFLRRNLLANQRTNQRNRQPLKPIVTLQRAGEQQARGRMTGRTVDAAEAEVEEAVAAAEAIRITHRRSSLAGTSTTHRVREPFMCSRPNPSSS